MAALRNQEHYHAECLRLLQSLRDGQHTAIQPLSVLVEVTAAIRRRTGSQELARRVGRDLGSLDSLRFVELDRARAQWAVELATAAGVRGMDALVVQVAVEFGATLLSLDEDLLERVKGVVQTRSVSGV